MSKEQIVSDAKASFVSGQDQVLNDVLGSVYDQAAQEQKASDGTLTQADLDAAVADVQAKLDAAIAQDGLDAAAAVQAKADGDAAVAAIQAKLDEVSAAKSVEDGVIQGLQSSIVSIQGALDALHALFPAPPQA